MSLISDEDNELANMNSSISETHTRSIISIGSSESTLAISYNDCKIGAAYYYHNSSKIQLLHEMYEFDDFVVIQKLFNKLMPTNVLISSKCDSRLFNWLKSFSNNFNDNQNETNQYSTLNENENDQFNMPLSANNSNLNVLNICFQLHILSSKYFCYDQCKSQILLINFAQLDNISDKKERFIYLSSYINFFEINTIKSLGVLLHFIEKQLLIEKSNSNVSNILSSFVYFDLDYFVSMDQQTFEALDIFQNEWHPSTTRKGLAKKESLTVFGIFNNCASKVGSHYLKKIFLQPISDFSVLEERFNIIEYFIEKNNANLKATIYDFMRNLKDVSSIINRFKSIVFNVGDFKLLNQTAKSVISIRNIIANNQVLHSNNANLHLKLFDKIVQTFSTELDELNECLEKTIDFKKSTDKIMIKKGIDEELDQLKLYFNKLPEILKIVITKEDEINRLIEKYDINVTIIYVPQIGFMLKLLLIEAQKIPEIDQYGLDLIFCANDSAYYKTEKTLQFDNIFGDILSEINDRTQQILMDVKDFVLNRIPVLLNAINICAFLDAMIALAQTAQDYNLTKPAMTCNGIIKIHQGRHPLYQLITECFVPNDYYSDQYCKSLVIFGLNGSGKTVYLKQVCLIVYLAHIGSFVPAQFAQITIVDKIFTRIRTPESISTQLSSFKHDLNQMIDAVKHAKNRSLVVIDLFGIGTLYFDGIALLEACLNYWSNRDDQPHLLISTQFNLISKLINKNRIRCYSFGNSDGINDFKLKLFEKSQDNTLLEHVAPELVNLSKLFQENQKDKFFRLKLKQDFFLKLSELVTNNGTVEQIDEFLKLNFFDINNLLN